MKRRDFIRTVGAAAAAAAAAPVLSQASSRIVLGQSAALTGPAAQLGIQFQRGAKLYFDRINARGGVQGKTIELVSLDDGYEPDRCKANTEKLIKDDVFALFGYIGTPTSLAALPLATAAKLPFFAPFTGAQALRDPFNRYAFHVRASYFDETAKIVNQLYAVGMRKIAVFHQNDSYGQAGLAGVTKALEKLNAKPVSVSTVERNSVDVATAVQAIVPTQPEAIVQISAYKSCAAFVREARKAGFGGQFCNVSFVGTAALAKELGPEARGVVVSQVMPYPFAPTTALSGEFLQAVAAVGEVEPNYGTIEGFVAAKTFVEGLKRTATPLNRENLVNGLESLRELDLGGFFVDFNARKHTGSSYVDMTILTQDGHVRR
jgi:ABC-type branched-subunit amino acid transport system substrate-binding protein